MYQEVNLLAPVRHIQKWQQQRRKAKKWQIFAQMSNFCMAEHWRTKCDKSPPSSLCETTIIWLLYLLHYYYFTVLLCCEFLQKCQNTYSCQKKVSESFGFIQILLIITNKIQSDCYLSHNYTQTQFKTQKVGLFMSFVQHIEWDFHSAARKSN